MTYTIEATGLGGWMSYRYQYKVEASDFFGYAETLDEVEKAIQRQVKAIKEKAGKK